jgi:hypothetical protein
MRLNRTPGRFAIRIVASKEQALAGGDGVVSFQYIAEPKNGTAPATSSKSRQGFLHGPVKCVVIGALAAGVATAGALVAGKSGSGASPSSPATTPSTPTSTITIGGPSLTVGKP